MTKRSFFSSFTLSRSLAVSITLNMILLASIFQMPMNVSAVQIKVLTVTDVTAMTKEAAEWDWGSNTKYATSCGSNVLMGGASSTYQAAVYKRVFDTSYTHTSVTMTIDFWLIDTWADHSLTITVTDETGGTNYFAQKVLQANSNQWTTSDICGDPSKPDVSGTVTITFSHNANKMKLSFSQDSSDAQLGVRNIQITLSDATTATSTGCATTIPAGQLTGGNCLDSPVTVTGLASTDLTAMTTEAATWTWTGTTPYATQCGTDVLMGGYLASNYKGANYNYVFKTPYAHSSVVISIDFWLIDTWSGRSLTISILDEDGTSVYNQKVLIASSTSWTTSTCGDSNKPDLSGTITVKSAHKGAKMTIKFLEDGDDNMLGIRNIKIDLSKDVVTTPTGCSSSSPAGQFTDPYNCQCATGKYKDTSGNCQTCDSSCQGGCTGAGPTKCNGCASSYSFSNGQCCSSNCAICTPGSASTCASCSTGKYLITGSCSTCDSSCQGGCAGAGPASCANCAAGYSSNAGSCCSTSCATCVSGSSSTCKTCSVGSYFSSGSCSSCDSSCQGGCTAGGPSSCASCGTNYPLNNGQCCSSSCATCVTGSSSTCKTCNLGFYLNNGQCTACDSTCQGGCTGGGPNNCNDCKMALHYDGAQCCSLDCATCTSGSSTTCASCKIGFYLSEGKCTPCDTSCAGGCTEAGPTKCNACKNGFLYDSAQCCSSKCATCTTGSSTTCSTCSIGFYLSEGQCVACDSTCANGCIGAGPAKCNVCKSGFPYDGAQCCSSKCATCTTDSSTTCASCSIGFYLKDGKCVACDSTCAGGCTGAGPANCIACKNGFPYDGAQCCLPSCETCITDSSTKCATCSPDLHLKGDNCCSLDCATCPSASPKTCLSCNTTSYLDTGKCHSCDEACDGGCTGAGPTKCTTCKATFPMSKDSQCCSSSCATCAKGSSTTCTSCSTGFYLLAGKCLLCDDSCNGGCTGTGPTKCLTCKAAFPRVNNQCCDSECATCAPGSADSCDSCRIGFYLSEEKCVPRVQTAKSHTLSGNTSYKTKY